MIPEETYQHLLSKYPDRLDGLIITDIVVGLHLTAVKLSDASYGIASTVHDNPATCRKEDRDYEAFSPGRIRGSEVRELFETGKRAGILNTLRIAVLNAVSSSILPESPWRVADNVDPIDLIDLSEHKTVVLVGAFQSYIRRLAGTGNRLCVLEMSESALPVEHRRFYVPAGDYAKVIPAADLVVISGMTLVNGTIEGLLSAVPSHATVVVTGPSGSMIPDILFSRGVYMIGATRITDGPAAFTIAGEGGAGYHLFHAKCAKKICILREAPE